MITNLPMIYSKQLSRWSIKNITNLPMIYSKQLSTWSIKILQTYLKFNHGYFQDDEEKYLKKGLYRLLDGLRWNI